MFGSQVGAKSILSGKPRWQECEVAGHGSYTVRQKIGMDASISVSFPLRSSTHVMLPHTLRVFLNVFHPQVNVSGHIPSQVRLDL